MIREKQIKRFFLASLFFVLSICFFGRGVAKAQQPVISNIEASYVTSISAEITWTTDIDSNSLVDFGLDTSYGDTSGSATESVKDHSVTLNGLNPDTTYFFRVNSTNEGDEASDDNDGSGYEFTTASSPTIENVGISQMTDDFVTFEWQTNIQAYPFVAYGLSDSYGKIVGDEDTLSTSHNISIAGLDLGSEYHYLPRVKDVYGNYTNYDIDNTFTLGAPHLESFTSTTTDGDYGPGDVINVTANYSENLNDDSYVEVVLNTGVSLTLDSIVDDKLVGEYVVGDTGAGENVSDLTVSSISVQNACDSNSYCYSGTTLPFENLNNNSSIGVDTTAPVFSDLSPSDSADINSVTNDSDISYHLSEDLSSGTISISRVGGNSDANSPHYCTLNGSYLNAGAHDNFDTSNCDEGAISLVDGAVYDIEFHGIDMVGNESLQTKKTNITFDVSEPVISSFDSTSADGAYGPGSSINISAVYDESLSAGSSLDVVLNTGASVTLDSVDDNTISGNYIVGETGSGEDSSDLEVSSIESQNTCDHANNCQTGTSLPGVNISDNSNIVVDTTAPLPPEEVLFLDDPVNISNEDNIGLRVSGEPESTIFYSIDDEDSATDAISGEATMESDGTTDIEGLDVSGLSDGNLTASVYLRDQVLNSGSTSDGFVVKDTANPIFDLQYYSDVDLTDSLGDNPKLKEGEYYIKITSNEPLQENPIINIDSEGTANDVVDTHTESLEGEDYKYVRIISHDDLAVGDVLEDISISATDINNNSTVDAEINNESSKAAYTDTIQPTVSGEVSPEIVGSNQFADVSLIFNEAMNQAVNPSVVIRKSDDSTSEVTGSFVSATEWSGSVEIYPDDADGETVLEVASAEDEAGNIMNNDNSVDTFIVDIYDPELTVNEGTETGPVKEDVINITSSDTGSGVAGQYYGFSPDDVCDDSDVVDNFFNSGEDFVISGDHTDYLCAKVEDEAGNEVYLNVGKLNTDNTEPSISEVDSNHSNGSFTVGETIDIIVNFSEEVTSNGDVTVDLDTGGSCTFSLSSELTGTCDYTVQSGENSPDLNVSSISGDIEDEAGNALIDFTPETNLADNKDIVIDTEAPSVDIISPLGGEKVDSSFVVEFSDNEFTHPQCSINDNEWISCVSNSTVMSDLTGWGDLPDGEFNLNLRDIDEAGNVGEDTESDLEKDTTAPTIDSVSSSVSDGSYKEGETIDIIVNFSEEVTSNGDVTVDLDTGGSCTFSLSSESTGTCDYTVQSGENSPDLNVSSISGDIEDEVGDALVDFTPASNLADNKDVEIDTIPPTIQSVNSDVSNGTYGEEDTIDIDIAFTEAVTSSGLATVTLNSGGSCTFSVFDSTNSSCNYTVEDGQNSEELDVISITGDLYDSAGNLMEDMSIPESNNLADNKDIKIDTTSEGDPFITELNSSHSNGIFGEGEVIDISVNFSEKVTSNGYVTVTLDTGGSCTFSLSSESTGTCDYTVQSGENSPDLNVSSISGDIEDEAGNALIDFTPETNLADNKDIVIDTEAPSAPSVEITDPITDDNKNSIDITGTGEADTTINYSIDDEDDKTETVTGTDSVDSSGNISLTGIDLSSLSGGVISAYINLTDEAGNVSEDTIVTATSTVERPTILSVNSDHSNGSFTAGETIDIIVNFSEEVTSNGDVTVDLDTGGSCTFSLSSELTGTCDYTVQSGENSPDLNVSSISGDIEDEAGNALIDFTPETNLADNKDIVIDTEAPNIDSFYSTNEDGIYSAGDEIEIIAVFDEDIKLDSSMTLILDTGATIVLDEVEENNKLSGVYIVGETGSGENTSDLKVESLSSHDVCDITGVCQDSFSLPPVNISDNSTIIVDTKAPVFHSINPKDGENINNVTNNSDISYSISEDLESGSIEFVRTAWEDDPDSPHICNLKDSFLKEGEHLGFNTENCQEGAVELASGAVYTLNFQGVDLNGNEAKKVSKTAITFGLDDKKPVISDVRVSNITSKEATIEWKTNEKADSYVEYGLTKNLGQTYGDKSLKKKHLVDLPPVLSLGSKYYYRVVSKDSSGNEAVSDIKSFKTKDASEIEEIEGGENVNINSVEVSDIESSSATVSWKTSQKCNGIVRYGLDDSYGNSAAEDATIENYSNFNLNHEVSLVGLLSNATYNYRVISYDIYGNIYFSENKKFSTSSMASVSGVSVDNIELDSATITWETASPTSSEIEYGVTEKYGETVVEETSTNYHKIELTDLEAGQTYHFRVKGEDDDEVVASDDYVFATYPEPELDSYEITDVDDKKAIINCKTNIPTETVIEYRNINNPEDRGSKGTSEISDLHEIDILGLEQGSEYEVKVKGVDINKNKFESEVFRFTTEEDTEPPEISDIKIEASLTSQKSDSVQAIIFWKTNEPSSSQVLFDVGVDKNEEDFSEKSEKDMNYTTNHLVVLTNLKPGVVYKVKVVSADENENKRESEIYTILTPQKEKSVIQMIISNFEETFGWLNRLKGE
ncbi:MAG: fibronectin type III domain-containing protein [Patescibacteria group bacterium]